MTSRKLDELAARIIDPDEWETYDGLSQASKDSLGPPHWSLVKAREILDLLELPHDITKDELQDL